MVLIAHLADTHIGAIQYGLLEREEDFYSAFRKAIDKAIEEHVRLVLISGDVVDKPRLGGKPLRVLYHELKKLRDRGIDVVVILGEHDFKRVRGEEPILYLFADQGLVKVIGIGDRLYIKRNVDGYELLVAGVSKHRRNEIKHLLKKLQQLQSVSSNYSGKSVLMLHQGLKEVNPHAGEISVDNLPKNFNYYALGHYHVMNVGIRVGDRGIAAYPGSTEVLRVDELVKEVVLGTRKALTAEKGFLIVDLSGDEPIIHRVGIDVRPQFRIELDLKLFELKNILNTLANALAKLSIKPVLHIKFRGKIENTKQLDTLLSATVGKYVLTYRWEMEDSESISEHCTVPKDYFDMDKELHSIIVKELGSEELARLALDILEIVRSSTQEHQKVHELAELIDRKLLGDVK